MPVNQQAVRDAASRARPTKWAIPTGKTGRDGSELFVHLFQEPGESVGQMLTRGLKDGSITGDMIPESIQGTGATFEPPGRGLSFGQAALLETGATQQDLGRGVLALTTDRTLEDNHRLAANESDARRGISENSPGGSLTGTFAGSILPVPGGPIAQGVAGVTQGFLERAGRGDETTTANAALDAGLSVLPGTLAQRLSVRGAPSNSLQRQVNLLESKKIPLSPAERSQGRALGAAERALDPAVESTFAGRVFSSARRRDQSRAINREVSSQFGRPLDNLSGDALDGVSRDLGKQFDDVLDNTAIGQLRLTQAVNDAKAQFASGVVRPDQKVFTIADRIVEKFPDGVTGTQYSSGLRSELLAESRSLWKDPRNHKNAQAIDALISRLDEAFEAAGGNTARYANLRNQWNMLRLTRAAVDTSGNVSTSRLATALRREGILGEFRDFVDAAATVTKPLAGNSGTADRLLGADFLGNIATGRFLDPRNVVNAVPPLIEFINSGSASRSLASAAGRGLNTTTQDASGLLAERKLQGGLLAPLPEEGEK